MVDKLNLQWKNHLRFDEMPIGSDVGFVDPTVILDDWSKETCESSTIPTEKSNCPVPWILPTTISGHSKPQVKHNERLYKFIERYEKAYPSNLPKWDKVCWKGHFCTKNSKPISEMEFLSFHEIPLEM
jgi:hypothetical protein